MVVRSTSSPRPPASPVRRLLAGLALVLVAPVLAACGGDDGDGGQGGSAASSTPTFPAVSAEPATGTAVSANGYRYALPDGWQVITDQLKATNPAVDSGGRDAGPSGPFLASLNTTTTANQVTSTQPTRAELVELASQLKAEVVPLSPQVRQPSPVSVAGVPAIRQEGRATDSGSTFYLEQYWLVTMGSNFGFTFAFPTDDSAQDRQQVVDSVLASVRLAS